MSDQSPWNDMSPEMQEAWIKFLEGHATSITEFSTRHPGRQLPILWHEGDGKWYWINREQRRKLKK